MNMMRNLFGSGGQGLPGPLGNIAALFQKFNQFVKNPFGALLGMGINIPNNLSNDPKAMVNYLRNSGQMNDNQFSQIKDLAEQFQNFMPK